MFKNSTLIVCVAVLAGCASTDSHKKTANDIASMGGLKPFQVSASPFVLSGWKRISAPDQPINLYIEGDGRAWLSRSRPSKDPTPHHPVALELTAADPAENVVYLARPCQFTAPETPGNNCTQAYWTGKRFAPEVIRSYQRALNQFGQEFNKRSYHLIGYSGGANITGLLAASRDDVLSLRSVAGNLDNDFFTEMHRVSPMPYSLNMADEAYKLRDIPQIHFISDQDKFVPPAIYQSYSGKLYDRRCTHSRIISGTTHKEGWAAQWPELLHITPQCTE